jgi:hypothetical protein
LKVVTPACRPDILYASGEWRHLFVNLSMTLASLFLLLKDLRRIRLAGGLTGASARSNPWYCEENTERDAIPAA